jgi:type VI secretion system secreted protein VgrG
MAKYSQANRWLKVHTPLGDDAVLIEGFHGNEAVSELYRFELDVLVPGQTGLPYEGLLGQPVAVELTLPDAPPRFYHGIVEAIEERDADEAFVAYQLTVVPTFWLLTRIESSRIFQQMTVPDILRELLAKLDVSYELQGTYRPHNYCVQYGESDFTFATRLMEEEGIHYYFRHQSDGHTLVLADFAKNAPDIAGPSHIEYDRNRAGERRFGRVHEWRKRQEIRSTRYTLRDYSLAVPDQTLEASEPVREKIQVGTVSHSLRVEPRGEMELYSYPAGYAHRFDVIDPVGGAQANALSELYAETRRIAHLRMEEEAAATIDIRGAGTCGQFMPGHRFSLARHPRGEGGYWLHSVEHVSRMNTYRSDTEELIDYRNTFRCLPDGLTFRPPRTTPTPDIGLQTATVVGIPGEEITTDKFGRIKVRFHWDRFAPGDHRSSCWLRVVQNWAGKGWGTVNLPWVGQEVVVDFLENDPDGPLVMGSVNNSQQMSTFPLPDQRTRAGIKAQSHGVQGDPTQYSMVGLETEGGKELVRIHSQLNRNDTCNSTHHESVGEVHRQYIGQRHSRVVGGLQFSGKKSSSGSGGGIDSDIGDGMKWLKDHTGMAWGEVSECVTGMLNASTFGTQFWNTINPLSIGEQLLPALPIPPALAAGTTSTFGLAQAWVGGASDITYGTKASVHRGPAFSGKRSQVWGGPGAAGCRVLMLLFSAAEFAQSCLEADTATSDAGSGGDFGMGATGMAAKLIFELWMTAELALLANPANDFPSELTALARAQATDAEKAGALAIFIINFALATIGELALGALGTAGMGSGGGSGPLDDAPSVSLETHDNPQVISAPTISFCGTGLELPTCMMSATNGALSALVICQIDEVAGNITIDCGADGIISLQSGLEMVPNFLTLSPEGINVSSEEMISIDALENHVVVDPEEGITIQSVANLITVTEEGIVLTAGPNTITLTPEGIILEACGSTLELSAEGIVVNGATVELTADSELSLSAPMITAE